MSVEFEGSSSECTCLDNYGLGWMNSTKGRETGQYMDGSRHNIYGLDQLAAFFRYCSMATEFIQVRTGLRIPRLEGREEKSNFSADCLDIERI